MAHHCSAGACNYATCIFDMDSGAASRISVQIQFGICNQSTIDSKRPPRGVLFEIAERAMEFHQHHIRYPQAVPERTAQGVRTSKRQRKAKKDRALVQRRSL